jgi:hypothetical protein
MAKRGPSVGAVMSGPKELGVRQDDSFERHTVSCLAAVTVRFFS